MFPSKFKKLMVFDFESVGLHGSPLGYGAVVYELPSFKKIGEQALMTYPAASVWSDKEDWKWVHANVFPACNDIERVKDVKVLLRNFMQFCVYHGMLDGTLAFAAECAWPVEANAFSRAIGLAMEDEGDLAKYKFKGPYPIHEIATVLMCAGMDYSATFLRKEDEQPAHNPLNDARQSGRLLQEAIDIIQMQ